MVALFGSIAWAQSITESFTDAQGRTLLYRYTLEDLSDSPRPPGLLLYFHGNSYGSQVDMLDVSLQQFHAKEHGLIPVALASPQVQGGTYGIGTRHWFEEDIALIHDFLQTELPSRFSFDRNRIVFWGHSQGTCFLTIFIHAHGTSYGGGLYAGCGCSYLSPDTTWDTPADFRNRFKVFVQATTGDFLHDSSVDAYWFYKYRIGLDTFGDLSGSGGHCAHGTIRATDAIGWILGTRNLETSKSGKQLEPGLPLQLTERRQSNTASCGIGSTVEERPGEGDALWLPVMENGNIDVPPLNQSANLFKIETIAGQGEGGIYLSHVRGLGSDGVGNLYVADAGPDLLWRISATGRTEKIAGTGEAGHSGDGGPATAAQLSDPIGVAVDKAGHVYVADQQNHRIRRIDSLGVITTIAGTGEKGYSGDGGPAMDAALKYPHDVAADGTGNVYVADTYNHRIRRIDSSGVITTIAGQGIGRTFLAFPFGVAVDGTGNVYVADTGRHRILRIDSSGAIETIAGTGEKGYSGDGGRATAGQFNQPYDVAVDEAGHVYVADKQNHRIPPDRLLRCHHDDRGHG